MRVPAWMRTRRCMHGSLWLLACVAVGIALIWACGRDRAREPGKVCQPVAKFTASDAREGDGFGNSVSISGKLAVAAALTHAEGEKIAESAYVFDLVSLKEVTKLTPMGVARDRLDWRVSASGGRAVMTTWSVNYASSAYVFDLGKGKQTATLTVENLGAFDLFGYSVCMSGDRAIVGAPGVGRKRDSAGAAYVFNARDGKRTLTLTSIHAKPGDAFGDAVAMSDSFAVVAASSTNLRREKEAGAVYVFDLRTGKETARLTADPVAEGDAFGFSVAVCGNLALIGAPKAPSKTGAGAAYVYDLRTGELIVKLAAAEGSGGDRFGIAVAIVDGLAVVGAPHADPAGKENAGMAYGFDPATGQELARFTAEDVKAGDMFGISVAATKDRVVVGSLNGDSDTTPDTGAVYLFKAPAK